MLAVISSSQAMYSGALTVPLRGIGKVLPTINKKLNDTFNESLNASAYMTIRFDVLEWTISCSRSRMCRLLLSRRASSSASVILGSVNRIKLIEID